MMKTFEKMKKEWARITGMLAVVMTACVLLSVPVRADIASGRSGTCSWVIDDDGVLTIRPTNGTSGTLASFTKTTDVPWRGQKSSISKVVVQEGVKCNTQMSYALSGLPNCTEMDLSGLDTSALTDMRSMFSSCKSLISLDLSNFDTSKVKDMGYMFDNCQSLISVNLSSFNTSNVTSMSNMFSYCYKLTSLDLSNFDTSKTGYMDYMFRRCSGLTSLDLSSFDTSNVKQMNFMFQGCNKLKTLDLSNFNTSKVTAMHNMFQGIGVTSLDLSSFDTSNATSMSMMFQDCSNLVSLNLSNFDTRKADTSNMFGYCRKLQSVFLSENFKFRGATFPTPPNNSTYTEKWVREDKAYGPYTSAQLSTSYNESMAGVWVWDVKTSSATINFNANGGYTATLIVTQTSPFKSFTFPAVTRPTYYLTGWNTKQDGSGTMYTPNDNGVVTGPAPTGGRTYIYYAQWAKMASYKVEHYQQNVALDGYVLVETDDLWAKPNATVIPGTKTYDGFVSPVASAVHIADDNSTVVTYYYDRTRYGVRFDGNNSDTGTMEDQSFIGGISKRLSDNRFKRDGYAYTGWNTAADGSGTSYGDAQTVLNLANNGETVTLYAQWLDISTAAAEQVEGVYRITLKNGQTAILPNLPNGTDYLVGETDLPAGWSISGTENTEGVIVSNETSNAVITNRYSAEGDISLVAYKYMDEAIAPGAFEFELLDNSGSVIGTAHNGNTDLAEEILAPDGETTVENPYYGMSIVRFSDIHFTQAGTYTYQIREKAGDNSAIEYDPHTETVSVTVTDNLDGTLSAEAVYDDDGPIFINRRIPVFDIEKKGELRVTKVVTNADNGEEFAFPLTLTDAVGTPVADTYTVDVVRTQEADTYRIETEEAQSYNAYTENNADGTFTTKYGNNWNESRITNRIITIPGAETVHVEITYQTTNSYDYVCAWAGRHAEYTALSNSNDGSSFTGRLYGSTRTTKAYDIPGDTVTFGFYSNNSGTSNNYGFYATVSGVSHTVSYTDGLLRQETVMNGGSLTLKNGETAVIKNIPAGIQYSVSEDPKDGFELLSAEGTEGTIPEDGSAEAVFTNIYSAVGSAELESTKVFEGGEIGEEQFRFAMTDSTGAILQEAYAQPDGTIPWQPIDYTLEDAGQTYRYDIYEVKGDDESIAYDNHVLETSVKVTDNGDGTLGTEVTYEGSQTFTNAYKTAEIVLEADKTFLNGNLSETHFDFQLLDGETVLQTKTTDDSGHVAFDPLTYHTDGIGEHTYTIREVTTDADYVWDTHEETVNVTVQMNNDEALEATASYDEDGAIFVNNALPPRDLSVTKTVTGNVGNKATQFEFTLILTPQDGSDAPETITYEKGTETGVIPLQNGSYAFTLAHGETVTFKEIDANTTYEIREQGVLLQGYLVTKSNTSGTITDSNQSASFTNHKFISVPTSADSWHGLKLLLLGMACGIITVFLTAKKKGGKNEQNKK